MKNNKKYTTEQLLDVLGSYRRLIIRNGEAYPNVCLSDIYDSINFVLRVNNYDGFYKSDNNT